MRSLLCVSIVLVVASGAWAQVLETDHEKAVALVHQARKLSADKQYEAAEQLLKQAIALDPKYADAHANLGYIYEKLGRREQALAEYGQVLSIEPQYQYALRRFKVMFLEGPFPRWIKFSQVKFSPLSLVTDSCRVRVTDKEVAKHFAYTTCLLFPEEMGRHGRALSVEIPAAGGAAVAGKCIANRVCYGFILRPDGDTADLRIALYYPSATISRSGTDYTKLVPNLMHMALRIACYNELYLGRPVPRPGSDLLRIYMAELGPTGAEMWDDNIYLYDVDTRRTPVEWTRQVAHELGHYLLPPVGRFTEPEALANGVLGERLAMQWLASEAELVTGHRWPDAPARNAVSHLWGEDRLQIADYIARDCLGDISFWLQQGPDSLLLGGVGPDAFRYYIGFCLWVQAAHGPGMLRAMLDATSGVQPGDVVYAYKQQVAAALESGELRISAAGCNLPASKLRDEPLAGAMGWRAVKLAGGDTLVFTVYLPAGTWLLTVECPQTPGDISVAFDESAPVALEDGYVVHAEAGWHLVRLTRPAGADSALIQALRITPAPSTP